MKNLEAISILESIRGLINNSPSWKDATQAVNEAFELAEKALEKQEVNENEET